MASWKWPAVVNKILSDVPGINTLLNALLKQDPAGTTDVPAGAKRWVDTPEGKQFQNFNGSEWQSVGKLAHDAASVDGHSAATDVTPNTIPVRGADGRLPGDIAGTAEKAKEAQKLSEANPIEKGGTGATAAPQARQNLGVPPTNHASAVMDYGIGTESLYGHVKPHDELDVTLTAASGHAFSPAGAASLKDSLESSLAGLAGVVAGNAESQATKDAEQDEAIAEAQSSANAAAQIAEAIRTNDLVQLDETLRQYIEDNFFSVIGGALKGATICRDNDSDAIFIRGGSGEGKGAECLLFGAGHPQYPGMGVLRSYDKQGNATDIVISNGVASTKRGEIGSVGGGSPSTKFSGISIGASGTVYTAPGNGYFCIYGSTSGGGWLAISNESGNGMAMNLGVTMSYGLGYIFPAKKGDLIKIQYASWSPSNTRFVYNVDGE